MKLLTFILFFIIGLDPSTLCQTRDTLVNSLIDNAKILFCNNDTIGTIKALEDVKAKSPDNWILMTTNKTLSDLYLMKGHPSLAIETLKYAVFFKPTKYSYYNFKNNFCSKILNSINVSEARANMCLSISQIYLSQYQFDSSIYYLNLADCEYVAYQNCGNGVNMYRSFLSTYFADYYLTRGDTVNAINRLLDFFMNTDGNTKLITKKLKDILLMKYTQVEISKEVLKGIDKIKFVKKKNQEFDMCITFFGHTIKERGYGKTSDYRRYYTKNKSIDILLAP